LTWCLAVPNVRLMSTDEPATDRMNLRLTPSLVARIDTFAAAMRETTGLRVARAEAVRLLVERALAAAPELKRRGKR